MLFSDYPVLLFQLFKKLKQQVKILDSSQQEG